MVRPPYVAVLRLFAYAERYWPAIDGEACRSGADYLSLPVDRFCNAVQWWCIQRVKDEDRFLHDLERPMPGVPGGAEVTEEELKRDEENFMAFAAAMGIKPPSPPAETASA